MLKKLKISNYALIEEVEIGFTSGLTIITGETGAGKSILIGALSLLLGGRADIKKARDNNRKIVVEGTFAVDGLSLKEIFEQNDLDWEEEMLLRREVLPTGRSRSFVNDSPVSTSLLSAISSRLVDIHSQHQNLLIGARNFQLGVLDALADNTLLHTRYTKSFQEYVELRRKLHTLKERLSKSRENEEFIRFRLEQLKKLKPREGEQKELERRQEILADSASISESLSSAYSLFNNGEYSVLSRLGEIRTLLQGVNLSLFASEEDEVSVLSRLESAIVELTDISETLSDYMEHVDSNPELLHKVEDRLTALYDAQRRFKVADESALIALKNSLEEEYASLENLDVNLSDLEKKLKEKGKVLRRNAEELSMSRREAAEKFAARLMQTAAPLGMSNLKFTVKLEQGKLTPDGQDLPSFQCAFNKNQPLMPVEKIASGGEISRLMLCLKAVVASRMSLPTIIFDEVDTGVSGDMAARMAAVMKEIAINIQVLAITHLPQVAASGDSHFIVYKQDSDNSTHTYIKELSPAEREIEIAGMLSGTVVDEAAILNARSLLGKNIHE